VSHTANDLWRVLVEGGVNQEYWNSALAHLLSYAGEHVGVFLGTVHGSFAIDHNRLAPVVAKVLDVDPMLQMAVNDDAPPSELLHDYVYNTTAPVMPDHPRVVDKQHLLQVMSPPRTAAAVAARLRNSERALYLQSRMRMGSTGSAHSRRPGRNLMRSRQP